MFFSDLTVVSQNAKNITLFTKTAEKDTCEKISAHIKEKHFAVMCVCTSDKLLSDFS
jgi:hypothetical protein